MRRILLTSTPGLGHVLPLLRLARALRERGADVRWVTGPDGCEAVAREGFAVTAGGMTERGRFGEYHRRFPWTADTPGRLKRVHGFPHQFAGLAAPAMAADLVPVAEEWRPDVVVHDVAEMAGRVAAARLGVPSVAHAFGIPVPRAVLASADEVLAPLWESYAVTPRPDALYLDICPPALHNGEAPDGVRARPVRPAEGAPRRLRDRPLVYVTFGTLFNDRADVLREVVAGVAATGTDALVTVGADGDPAALAPLPPWVTVERFVPQAEVLPDCSAVVSHGGSGTTFAALAHGLPCLLLPQAADQFTNAEQAEAAGAAIALDVEEVGAAGVAEGVRRLLAERPYAVAAAWVASEIAAMPGPDEAAAAVEALAC